MPVRIEVIENTSEKKLGHMVPGKINIFPNYTPSGEREILAFDSGRNVTIVYLANSEVDEVDIIEEGVHLGKFQVIDTLIEGQHHIREVASQSGEVKKLRFTHIKKIPPIVPKPKLRFN